MIAVVVSTAFVAWVLYDFSAIEQDWARLPDRLTTLVYVVGGAAAGLSIGWVLA